MPRPRERVRLEDGLKLDLNRLLRQNLVKSGAAWGSTIFWHERMSGREIASGRVSADMTGDRRGWLRLQLGTLDQSIDLEALPRPYGGRQWYFLCPWTRRRASVLWMPPGAHSFASRFTWGRQVAYGSQFQSPFDRALSAAQDIRYRLGGSDYVSLDEMPPPKPKGMRWRTYAAIMSRCEAHEITVDRHLAGFIERLEGHR